MRGLDALATPAEEVNALPGSAAHIRNEMTCTLSSHSATQWDVTRSFDQLTISRAGRIHHPGVDSIHAGKRVLMICSDSVGVQHHGQPGSVGPALTGPGCRLAITSW